MKVLSVRPGPPCSGNTLARVDIELDGHLRLFNLKVVRRSAGGHAVYAPNALGAKTATFSIELANQIAAAATAAMELTPHDRS